MRTFTFDPTIQSHVRTIVDAVRTNGENALRAYANQFNDITENDPLIKTPDDFKKAYDSISKDEKNLLLRLSQRIRRFSFEQLKCITELTVRRSEGRAGHVIHPIERVGCYAPGGQYSLPSSLLMTTIPARCAGVKDIWVASPKPTPMTLAAAHIANANGLLATGGAQAIAALAYGAGEVTACDMVVGPGNVWVTYAKQMISGIRAIDTLAGPTELVIAIDETAKPRFIAVDLFDHNEHYNPAILD